MGKINNVMSQSGISVLNNSRKLGLIRNRLLIEQLTPFFLSRDLNEEEVGALSPVTPRDVCENLTVEAVTENRPLSREEQSLLKEYNTYHPLSKIS